MQLLLQVLFFIAASAFFLFVLTLIFSLFLIIWPFLAVGLIASFLYAWLLRYRTPGSAGKTETYQSEKIIIIEHDDSDKK